MPVAKKHDHTCPRCGKVWLRNCRSWQGCGGKNGPSEGPCWECQGVELDIEDEPEARAALNEVKETK